MLFYRYKNSLGVWRHHTVKILNFRRPYFLRGNLLNLPAHLTTPQHCLTALMLLRCILINHQMTRLTWDLRDPPKSSVLVWYFTIHFEKNYKRFLDSIWETKPQSSKLYSFFPSPIVPYLRLSVIVLRISIASLNTITVHSPKRANAFSVVASLHPKKKT